VFMAASPNQVMSALRRRLLLRTFSLNERTSSCQYMNAPDAIFGGRRADRKNFVEFSASR
jgi:hypothetical protein